MAERSPEEAGVVSSILTRGITKQPRQGGVVLSYCIFIPKTLKKFLNKVEGLAEGVGAGWGAVVSAGFS